MLRILIADDHMAVRQGLKQILAAMPEKISADEAENGYEVLQKVTRNKYDMLLMDISMPAINGLEVLKQLKQERPNLPTLILSIHPEEQYAVGALKAGASGYLTKGSTPEELIAAIRKVAAGGKYVSASVAQKLARYLQTEDEGSLHKNLSEREYEVMCMIASGQTVKEIAQALSLSVKTVSTYRSRVLQKMQMKNNAQLTHYAIRNELVN